MSASTTRWLTALALLSLVSAPAACGPGEEPGFEEWVDGLPTPVDRDWDAIVAGDTLRALLVSNSTTYFVYRGEAMGYEFRALRAFASSHDLALQATIVRDRAELFRMLNEGVGDVVAARLVPVPAFESHVAFTDSLYRTRPTVVQQARPLETTPLPEQVEDQVRIGPAVVRARLVRRPRELAGTTVHMPRGSEYVHRLVELSDTITGEIEVLELEDAATDEAVIRLIAGGAHRLTVTSENLAELSDEYFTNIEIRPALGPSHAVRWAVRTTSPSLRDSLDAWIARNDESELADLYQTYFIDRATYRERVYSEYLTSATGRLSPYDSLIAAHAARLDWDWRLLASQAFQESRFDPQARSWAGAMGILQLMPGTARDMGVDDPYDPEENVAGAVRYLEWLDRRWSEWIPDAQTRLPFLLSSYNAGTGHVEDARRLTEAMGDDPDSWDAVSYWLLQLTKRQHYEHPVVRFGYVRGLEPVTYVALIRERYGHYLEFVTADPAEVEAAPDAGPGEPSADREPPAGVDLP